MPKIQQRSRSAPSGQRRKPAQVVSMADLVEDLRSQRGGKKRTPWVERFWLNVRKGERHDCWEWIGNVKPSGYGFLSISNAQYRVHRLAFLIKNGTIDPNLFVIHSCDNKRCVNPAHLSQDTLQENVKQALERDKVKRGERHGMAKLSETEVREIRARYATGGVTQRTIAAQFGVRDPQICRIVNFKSRRRP